MEFSLTSPFGARGLSVEMIDGQRIAASCDQSLSADKWQILRDLTDCRRAYDLSDRAIGVLSALLSFHSEDTLDAADNLVVFPSNKKLCARAHGISEPTLRRHLASLVNAGLLVRNDSPNGKRYARRGQEGMIVRAFGFDLRPLLAQANSIHREAETARNEKQLRSALREDITLLRRAITKTISFGMQLNPSAEWEDFQSSLSSLDQRTDRGLSISDLKALHTRLSTLSQAVHNALEDLELSRKVNGSDAQNERHIQDSNKDYLFESETGLDETTSKSAGYRDPKPHQAEISMVKQSPQDIDVSIERLGDTKTLTSRHSRRIENSLDLPTILSACSKISYCHRFAIRNWSDFVEAAETVRSILDVNHSAWSEAKTALGPVAASITLAGILEKCDSIRSPGGYLRSLTAKPGFSPIPMIQSLLASNLAASGA